MSDYTPIPPITDVNASEAVKLEMDENESRKQQPDESSKENTEIVNKSEAEGEASQQQTADTKSMDQKKFVYQQYFEKVISQVSLKMNHLNSVDDFVSDECFYELKFLENESYSGERSSKVGDELTSLGLPELFQKIWKKYFEMDFLSDDNDLMGAIMNEILIVTWNFTDKSKVLCEKAYRIGLHDTILSFLGSTYLDPSKTSQPDFERSVNGLMGILHNMLQKLSDFREALREKKAAEILQRFRDSPSEMVRCKALILQGYIVTEKENETLNSDEKTFQFMKKILEDALENTNHLSYYGLSAIEIIAALNRLAVNDNNKERFVDAGLLPLYVKMLQPECATAEQAAAAKGIWTLAFKCATEVENEPGCIQALQNLVDTSTDEVVVTQAKDALWELKQSKNDSRAPKDIPDGQEVATPSKANVLYSEKPKSVSNFGNWSTDDVKTWLRNNGLENFQNLLHEVDGSLLAEYRSMRQDAPETFFSMLEKKDFSLRDILRLTKALNQL